MPISDTVFTDIVGTFDGSTIMVYKNGHLFQQKGFEGTYADDPRLPLHIGSAAYCTSCEWWSGSIDDLRLYNRTLTQDEVNESFLNPSNIGDTEDKREKIQALSLAKECYGMKLELLTNATVVDDAIRFVSNTISKDKQKWKPSANDNEYNKEESSQPDYNEDKGQLEEEQEKRNRETTVNRVF